jgi:hypothetical protein
MSDSPFRGAFGHQHGDPRGLIERVHAQLLERIQEAVEMAGLGLMVELRRRHGRPAPDTDSAADRTEFEETARALLTQLRAAFAAELSTDRRQALDRAEAAAGATEPVLAGQAFLARELPDYWQRFEAHRAAYAQARLEAPPATGWLGRLFAKDHAARKPDSDA